VAQSRVYPLTSGPSPAPTRTTTSPEHGFACAVAVTPSLTGRSFDCARASQVDTPGRDFGLIWP
jgi:hypothetical protein